MRTRWKTAALLAVLAGVAAFVAIDAAKEAPVAQSAVESKAPARATEGSAQGPGADAAAPEPQAFSLPERAGLADSQSQLFASQSWQPPPPPPPKAQRGAAPPPPPPVAPPVPYTFVGKLVQEGRRSFFLARGDTVIPIREGETIDGTYKVESITDTQITLVYLPLGQKQTLPVVTSLGPALPGAATASGATSPSTSGVGAGALAGLDPLAPIPSAKILAQRGAEAAPAAATLAWGGPQQVKLGTRFQVTLRVNSKQPLHAWPMQLRVNPEQFEVVAVRPGKLPGGVDPNFSYRVNPDGAIFIGASLPQAQPASDAELLALTLMPLRAAPAAEVSIASLNLQGPAGRPIPHDQIASFRTSIVP